MSATRITDLVGSYSDWTGASGATENTNQTSLDFGTVAASASGTHKNLSVEFTAGSSTVYDDIRFWLLNDRAWTAHTWYAKLVTTATTPATTALTGGAAIGTSPDGATKGAAGTYFNVSSNAAIRYLQLQLQVGSSPSVINQGNELLMNPILVTEFQRTAQATTKLRGDYTAIETYDQGYLFTFSDVNLYKIDGTGDGRWQLIAAIKEDSFDLNLAQERVEWMKGKPSATYHQAISKVMTECKFKVDMIDPKWMSLAFDTSATEDTTDNTVDVAIDTYTRPVQYPAWVIEWRMIGGFMARLYVPKGKLSLSGSLQPGGSEFAGAEFTLTGLANGNRRVSTLRTSLTPIEQAMIPLTFNATA